MLTIEDCIEICRLTGEERAAVTEREHAPDLIALEMAKYLCIRADGERRLSGMIAADLEKARSGGDYVHAAKLRLAVQHFLERHGGVVLDRGDHPPS